MGCSKSSFPSTPVVKTEPLPPSEIALVPAVPTDQSSRLVENCIILWFVEDTSMNMEEDKSKIRRIVSTLKIFNNSDDMLTFINNIHVEKLFIILSSPHPSLQLTESLPQVEKIYHFDGTNQTIDQLCEQLKIDVDLCENDLVVIATTPVTIGDGEVPSNEYKRQEASFLCSQLMREVLFRIKFENKAKEDFVQFCRLHYKDSPEDMRMINEFDSHYRPQTALSWLLRECFLWRMIQRMQRTQEIDVLYKLGFFLKHIHSQLNLFQENNAMNVETTLIVYRGKTMSTEKFNGLIKCNVGSLLTFDSFLTTSMSKELALDFIRRRQSALPNVTGILFEIHIEPSTRSSRSPFASFDKIYSNDAIKDNGILFAMYTVFRIQSIECVQEAPSILWSVKLTLVVDTDAQLLRTIAPLRSSEVHANPIAYMGKLFMEIGDYEHAERFFLAMLNDPSLHNQPLNQARVYKGLATNYMYKKQYTEALEHYQQALTISLKYLPADHTDLVSLYDSIGRTYYEQGDYHNAMDYYERAASLLGHNHQSWTDPFATDLSSRIIHTKKLMNNTD